MTGGGWFRDARDLVAILLGLAVISGLWWASTAEERPRARGEGRAKVAEAAPRAKGALPSATGSVAKEPAAAADPPALGDGTAGAPCDASRGEKACAAPLRCVVRDDTLKPVGPGRLAAIGVCEAGE